MEAACNVTRLPNGVRIVTAEMPWMRSVSVGIWAGTGARHESARSNGLSHFVEHLLFKGTKKRNAREITAAVEGVGGYINAFTSEDHTCYYAKAGSEHIARLIDVLTDMYLNSEFPESEIDREREVIREEILMVRDQPAQHVQEVLSEVMWPAHPLGRPLTGTVQSIANFQQRHFRAFVEDHYNGRNTVVAVAGRVTHPQVVELLRPVMERLHGGRVPRFWRASANQRGPAHRFVAQDTEQAHLTLGFHACGRRDDRRYAMKILSVLLAENMSSRLFQQLREKHGCCYSVNSAVCTFAETGVFSICIGLDPSKLEKTARLLRKELARISERPVGKSELCEARDYSVGQMMLGLESTNNRMMWLGECMLGYGKIVSPTEVEKRLQEVSARGVQEAAGECLKRSNLAVAMVGPHKDGNALLEVV